MKDAVGRFCAAVFQADLEFVCGLSWSLDIASYGHRSVFIGRGAPDAAAGAFPKNASEMREPAARSAAEPDAITRPVSKR